MGRKWQRLYDTSRTNLNLHHNIIPHWIRSCSFPPDMDSSIDEEKYKRIEGWCQTEINRGAEWFFDPTLFRSTLREKSSEWNMPYESLHSWLRNLHLYHVKIMARHIQKNVISYTQQYASGLSILELSKKANYPPYLMSRYIVEEVANLPDGKRGLTRSMRDPIQILGSAEAVSSNYAESERHRSGCKADTGQPITRLAAEVDEALEADALYGPKHDRWRHIIGVEYEVVLEDMLNSMDIPFESESDLRDKGSARTPDVLLQCPIGVLVGDEWRVVHWIDSKALYGDEGTHQSSVLPQAESYVHRFGPGMILYWFGHAPLSILGDSNGDLVIQGWELPTKILWPTGEFGYRSIPQDDITVNKTDEEP